MSTPFLQSLGRPMTLLAVFAVFAACSDHAPAAVEPQPSRLSTVDPAEENLTLATLRQATDRYHRLDSAIADGFVFLHGCEVRPEGGPVGIVYINPRRLLDGAIDPTLPDGLIYEPRVNESPRLVAVEFAIPFSLSPEPPNFLGATFQREDEFGVFGLHVWLWRHNAEGLFAESNPDVICAAE